MECLERTLKHDVRLVYIEFPSIVAELLEMNETDEENSAIVFKNQVA